MLEIAFITGVGQIFIPLLLILWLGRGGCRSRLEWVLKCLAAAVYLALISVVGIWLLAPWYMPYGMAIVGLGAALKSHRTLKLDRQRGANRTRAGFRLGSLLAGVVFSSAVLFLALRGYSPPEMEPVCMGSPLRDGTYYVINGGYSILTNPHMKTLKDISLNPYRAQSYALDFVKIDPVGLRARWFWPEDLSRYEIFAEPVVAPCNGRVIRTETLLPDLVPPERDPGNPAGNFVYLECGEQTVLLAHLKRASIVVAAGGAVHQGQTLGRVGDLGNTLEPHLHLHAQRRGHGSDFLSADPLPLKIDGRTLVRGSRVVFE
jgi:hypothetical protein